MGNLIDEDDLARARNDPAFRHQLMAENLDRLLEALKRARRDGRKTPEAARLIREGVALAVQLAERLNHGGRKPPTRAA